MRLLRHELYAAIRDAMPEGPPIVTYIVDDPDDAENYQLVTILPGGDHAAAQVVSLEATVRAAVAARGARVVGRLEGEAELEAFTQRRGRGAA